MLVAENSTKAIKVKTNTKMIESKNTILPAYVRRSAL